MWKQKLCLGVGGFGISTEEQIKLFAATGFDAFFTGWHYGAPIAEWKKIGDECGLIYQSLHAPFDKAAVMWTEGEKADAAVEELCACVRACAENGIPVMVAHAFIGFKDHAPNEHGIRNYGRVADEAARLGVTLALENTEGEEYLAALMDAFKDRTEVKFCWDTGHELCYNHGKDMTALYGDRLAATHLNDNLGISRFDGETYWTDDLHLLPFDGITDWQSVASRLEACGFDGILTFELNTKSKPNRHENDCYAAMPVEQYIAEVYKRACRVAALRRK